MIFRVSQTYLNMEPFCCWSVRTVFRGTYFEKSYSGLLTLIPYWIFEPLPLPQLWKVNAGQRHSSMTQHVLSP